MPEAVRYIIPTEELTLTDIKAFRSQAVEAGIARAIAKKLINNRADAVVREAQPAADFGCATDAWLTTPLAVVNTPVSVFPAAAGNPLLGPTRIAVFYKVGVNTAPNPITLLSFREGAGAGTTYAVFNTEVLDTKLETDGYFTEPVVFDNQRVINIVVTPRVATLLAARVILGCFIIEPRGAILSV